MGRPQGAEQPRQARSSLPDATTVFAADGAITIADDDPREERYVTIGHDGAGRLLVVVFTWRGDEVARLISARKATHAEAQSYYLSGR